MEIQTRNGLDTEKRAELEWQLAIPQTARHQKYDLLKRVETQSFENTFVNPFKAYE